MKKILFCSAVMGLTGCWDEVVHNYDNGDLCTVDSDSVTDTGSDTGSDSGGIDDTDTATSTANDSGNTTLPAEWRGFGTSCTTDADCNGYPSENKRCIHNVLNIINAPQGYCTACCNEPGADKCGPGIDCVGADNAYLVCLAHCDSNSDCRGDEFWDCRPIYYVSAQFPGNFCLPDEQHNTPDTDGPQEELICPWPWTTDN